MFNSSMVLGEHFHSTLSTKKFTLSTRIQNIDKTLFSWKRCRGVAVVWGEGASLSSPVYYAISHTCRNTHILMHTHTGSYNIMPERNLENDPWGVDGRSRGNSSDEVWQFEWDFMVGTARNRDIYQPSQHAGKHRSHHLYPVVQPEAQHTLQIQSSITLPTVDYCLFAGGIMWIGPGNILPVFVLL